jgi:hypothetical protein
VPELVAAHLPMPAPMPAPIKCFWFIGLTRETLAQVSPDRDGPRGEILGGSGGRYRVSPLLSSGKFLSACPGDTAFAVAQNFSAHAQNSLCLD